jgi:hypothetical protein
MSSSSSEVCETGRGRVWERKLEVYMGSSLVANLFRPLLTWRPRGCQRLRHLSRLGLSTVGATVEGLGLANRRNASHDASSCSANIGKFGLRRNPADPARTDLPPSRLCACAVPSADEVVGILLLRLLCYLKPCYCYIRIGCRIDNLPLDTLEHLRATTTDAN